MPINRALYPDDWDAIALEVKNQADWECEHCGRPCRPPGRDWADFVMYDLSILSQWERETSEEVYDDETGEWGYVEKPQRFTLTVSHKDHDPGNCDRANLQALCAPCHLRYDAAHHAATRKRNRRKKQECEGQLTLL